MTDTPAGFVNAPSKKIRQSEVGVESRGVRLNLNGAIRESDRGITTSYFHRA